MLKSFAEKEGEDGYLDLLSDPSMEQFFSRGIRGGQSFISQRYAEGETNPENAGEHLLYVDGRKHLIILYKIIIYIIMMGFPANNLYGSMETLKLPVSNFAWLSSKDLQQMTPENILKLPAQDDIGYAFEVDLQYPNHLHKVINFFLIL